MKSWIGKIAVVAAGSVAALFSAVVGFVIAFNRHLGSIPVYGIMCGIPAVLFLVGWWVLLRNPQSTRGRVLVYFGVSWEVGSLLLIVIARNLPPAHFC